MGIDIISYVYIVWLTIRATQPSISSCSSEAFTGNLGMRPADEIKDFGLGLQGPPYKSNLNFLFFQDKTIGIVHGFLGIVDADAFCGFNGALEAVIQEVDVPVQGLFIVFQADAQGLSQLGRTI